MGKPTGFLEIPRKDHSYKPVKERIKAFKEFKIELSDDELNKQGARCMDCGIPFCHEGCPVNNIIPDWNDLVYNCLLYTSPSPRDATLSRMPSSA